MPAYLTICSKITCFSTSALTFVGEVSVCVCGQLSRCPLLLPSGMAVLCVSLVSPTGTVLAPQPGIMPPNPLPSLPSPHEEVKVEIREEFPVINSSYSIALHIWERGNVGMADLRNKLVSCLQCALQDMLLELHALQLPVATLTDVEIERLLSPALLSHPPPSANESITSFEEVDLEMYRESPILPRRELLEVMALTSTPKKHAPEEKEQNWEDIERQRRRETSTEVFLQQARMGQLGTLEASYLPSVQPVLKMAEELGSSSVQHTSLSVPCGYVVETLLSQLVNLLREQLPALTYSAFRGGGGGGGGYNHQPLEDRVLPVSGVDLQMHNYRYLLLGRDLDRWREMMSPADQARQSSNVESGQQLHLPLNSWRKEEGEAGIPLMSVAKKHSTFVPRQMMVLALLSNRQVSR